MSRIDRQSHAHHHHNESASHSSSSHEPKKHGGTNNGAAKEAAAALSAASKGSVDDFQAVQNAYDDLQKNAYSQKGSHAKGQSVTGEDVGALKGALDSYIKANVTDSSQSSLLKKVAKNTDHMMGIINAPEHNSKSSNAAWDHVSSDFEDLLSHVAPSQASEVHTPQTTALYAQAGKSAAATKASQTSATQGSAKTNSQSGAGWQGDLNNAATSKTYKGQSLDQLLANKSSLVAKEIGKNPAIVSAIRKVSGEYNIPDGLLAATIIQETNGDNSKGDLTANSGYSDKPADQRYDAGIIQSPLWKFPGKTTAEKIKNALDPVQCLTMFAKEASADYKKSGSWGVVLRNWNSGGNANPNNLAHLTDGYGVSSYVKNILGNIAMGGGSYGS